MATEEWEVGSVYVYGVNYSCYFTKGGSILRVYYKVKEDRCVFEVFGDAYDFSRSERDEIVERAKLAIAIRRLIDVG